MGFLSSNEQPEINNGVSQRQVPWSDLINKILFVRTPTNGQDAEPTLPQPWDSRVRMANHYPPSRLTLAFLRVPLNWTRTRAFHPNFSFELLKTWTQTRAIRSAQNLSLCSLKIWTQTRATSPNFSLSYINFQLKLRQTTQTFPWVTLNLHSDLGNHSPNFSLSYNKFELRLGQSQPSPNKLAFYKSKLRL